MRDTTIISDRSQDAISFRVDDVTPAQKLMPCEAVAKQLRRQYGRPFLAFSHDPSFEVVHVPAVHPLVNAVQYAFSEHRPLLLTPDMIWMVIAQGFAQHVNDRAEQLRKQFVRHEGKLILKVETLELSTPEHWAEVVDMWSEEICRHVVADFESLLVCKFSTTTPTIRTASQVIMMNAFRQYFDYRITFICGIPEITVKGTVDDWCVIRDRVKLLANYDLKWWTRRLLPICDGFIETVKGRPSEKFWQHIYSPKEVYGGGVVTGWLADLFPYIDGAKNPVLSKPRSRIRVSDGISPKSFPNGLSQAPITLECDGKKFPLEIIGGFIGVTQNAETKYLQAEIGWAVREQASLDYTISELAKFHEKGRPKNWPRGDDSDAPDEISSRRLREREFGKEVVQIADQLGGGTLFGNSEHSWYVRPLDEHVNYGFAGRREHLSRFMDLPDGRFLLYTRGSHVPSIMLGKSPSGADQTPQLQNFEGEPVEWDYWKGLLAIAIDPEESVVVAKSFEDLFERILQANGAYYFDDPSFVADGSL